MAVRVALDLHGGDKAPWVNIEAVSLLSQGAAGLELIAVGSPSDWQFNLPLVRTERPIRDGITLVKNGAADAFVSAGDTSKVVINASFILGRLAGVSRPALASLFPTLKGKPILLLDVGATPVCTARNLIEFAQMSLIYAKTSLGWNKPRIALLSIGREPSKGSNAVKEAHAFLSENVENFIGNIEGHDLLARKADIVVTDGFVGNVLLKFTESVKYLLRRKIRHTGSTELRVELGRFLLKPYIDNILKDFDYSEYGGAPLLGVNGICLVAHGRSSPNAIKNAVLLAYKLVQSDFTGELVNSTDKKLLEEL